MDRNRRVFGVYYNKKKKICSVIESVGMRKGPVQKVISSMEYHKMSFSSLCALSC